MTTYVFKLRSNIKLKGDVELAQKELEEMPINGLKPLQSMTEATDVCPALGDLDGVCSLTTYCRDEGVKGYLATGEPDVLPNLIKKLSFVQRIYCIPTEGRIDVNDTINQVGPVVSRCEIDGHQIIQGLPHYALFEISDIISRRSTGPDETKQNMNKVLDVFLRRGNSVEGQRLLDDALTMKNTSSLLSHDIHYYKAKFFPRLARSVINIYGNDLDEESRVVDNFAGSGTALLEASLQGIPSTGSDLDPLSMLISQTKLDVLEADSAQLAAEVEAIKQVLAELTDTQESVQATIKNFNGNKGEHELASPEEVDPIDFPEWLMANQKMTEERAEELGWKIGCLRYAVEQSDSRYRDLFRVLMSDAIARKIKFRFLGTGVGRFSLTFTKTPIEDNFISMLEKYVKVAAISEWIQSTLGINYAESSVEQMDAQNISGSHEDRFDFLLTSPPYLPASSGRESYAKARAPSLIALGMFKPAEIADIADDAIGSMNSDNLQVDQLTEQERDLVEWLKNDDLREIKAAPTARYFLDMREVLSEMREILVPGATAVVVSGKQSTFYESESREPLYIAESADMLAQEAEDVGFEIKEMVDIQLQKPNKNARPRSLDDYYETLIVLQNPE